MKDDWKYVFDSINESIMILDLEHRILAANPATVKAAGLPEEELIGSYCYKIFHGSDSPPDGCPHEKITKNLIPSTIDMEMEALGGYFMVSVSPVFDEHGQLEKIVHVAKNITDRKAMEEQLGRLNRALMVMSRCNELLVHVKDEEKLLQEVCRIVVEIGGYRLAWIGFAEDDADKTVRPVAQQGYEDDYLASIKVTWADNEHGRGPTGTAIRTGRPYVCKNFMTDPAYTPWRGEAAKRGYSSGISLPLISSKQLFGALNIYAAEADAFDEEEVRLLTELAADLAYGISSLREKVRRKKAEGALEESENTIRAIFDSIIDGILVADVETKKFITGNRSICEMLGYSFAEITGLGVGEIHPKEDQPHVLDQFERQARKEIALAGDLPVLRKDGSVFYADINTAPVRISSRDCVIGVFRDISERKNMEDRLRQAQKMEAIGTLAGGIAHDFNNILSPIIGYTQLTLENLAGSGILRENLEQVLAAANRATDLVRQILTFSRKSELGKTSVSVQPIVKETLKLLRSSLPATIEIKQNIDKDCGQVIADPVQIQQVIMNLSTNALHAMQDRGGVLEVTLSRAEVKKDIFAVDDYLEPGVYLKLTVSDTGIGMDSNLQARVFEPYFTTKREGEGTGLGLSVVHGIVKSHNGKIEVNSEPGKGTTFNVYLPLAEKIAIKEQAEPVRIKKGSERILLVDDEMSIVKIVKRQLETYGYQVSSFTSSTEALAAFLAAPEEFDLVITDMSMPEMTGAELARKILATRSNMSIILCTGYSERINGEMAHDIGIREYVMKPIVGDKMAGLVRKVLDKR